VKTITEYHWEVKILRTYLGDRWLAQTTNDKFVIQQKHTVKTEKEAKQNWELFATTNKINVWRYKP
jgi:hypothetical protein